jgi:predicted PurR-regulated permease PerM
MNKADVNYQADPGANKLGELSNVRTFVLLTAIAFGIYLCYKLSEPFLPALVWAMTLAVLFTPFQMWFESKLRYHNLAALVSVLVIGLIVVVPAVFVGQRLFVQAAKGAEVIEAKVNSGEWRHAIEVHPTLAPYADKIEKQINLPGTIATITKWLSAAAGSIVMGSVVQLISFVMTFYLLFFFLRDRHIVLRSLRSLSPLSEAAMGRLFCRVRDTIYAMIYGTLTVAAIQGLLGGLMFWWLGLPAPLLWGVIMALLSVVPVLGAFVIWVPAVILLALEGSWGKALILILWGNFVVGTVDNLLRPVLVGKRLQLHTVLAFISVVGGLIFFGSSGLILGPVALTVTIFLLESWPNRRDA